MSDIVNIKTYNSVYEVHAWKDNNRTFKVTTGEGNIKYLRLKLRDNQGAIDLSSNPTISYVVTKANGKPSSVEATIVNSKTGEIEIPIEPCLTNIKGIAKGEIRIILSDAVLKFYGINLKVMAGATDEEIVNSGDFSDLIKALQKVVQLSESATGLIAKMDDDIKSGNTNPVASGVIADFLIANYVPFIRKIAGLDLTDDVTEDELRTALSVYPLITSSQEPTNKTVGSKGQMYLCTTYDGSIYTYKLYYCNSSNNDTYRWICFFDSSKLSGSTISQSDIEIAVTKYFDEHPNAGGGADGKSAYQIALDNGYEGTEKEWLESLNGADGQNGKDGVSPTIISTPTTGGNIIDITNGDTGGASQFIILDGITPHIGDNGNWFLGDVDTGQPSRGDKGEKGDKGEDGYTPVKGVDYFTDSDKAEFEKLISDEISKRGQLKPEFANTVEECLDTSKLYVLPDGYIYAFTNAQWSNTDRTFTTFDTLEKVIDACCDKEVAGSENYNLLKISEVTFQHRLQNDSEELVSSNTQNAVSGWIPVEYGKYYALSVLYNGVRTTSIATGSALWGRTHVKLADGTVLLIQQDNLIANNGITNSWSTLKASIPSMVAVRFQINFSSLDISTAEIMRSYEPMLVEGNTAEEARNNALTLDYIDGDTEMSSVQYSLKEDTTKADKAEVQKLRTDVETLKESVGSNTQVNATSLGSCIQNDRFIRSIANFRDTENANDFDITVTNNSGKTIKNAAIVVGLHNTVGINPNNNNLPFQVYNDMFSQPVGFKFFDGDTELPYYIESESNCNYIVDKNIKTDVKTIAVFSDGKIAVYNESKGRMQISTDDGATWADICENITSKPYRILLPDSEDNLFVASSDGYRLYKYTSADGYMTGTQVLDMESFETQIGTILAEDSDGNLYLGTYQSTPWRCTIRKSTDHGDTWSIVFDTTECQHVHNIFINTKVTPNEIFIGLDNNSGEVQTHLSTDGGATWTLLDVPYRNNDNAFRYAGENFYIGCGERNILGGATLYKTSDYNDPDAYYTLFDNCQGIRDVTNVVEGSDDVLIAGGCVDDAVRTQHLFLSEDRGETWKTVLMNPIYANIAPAGWGLRTFSHENGQIISQTSTDYALRFVYGNGAKTILAVVKIGDVPTSGKTITLKTGYVANIEQAEKVLTSFENIDGKVADIRICDGYVIDLVSNKRVLTTNTELCNSNIRVGQTSDYKYLDNHAYKLNGSVNLGKLSRLNFTNGFTVSLLFKKDKSYEEYLSDDTYHVIFQSGDTKLILWHRSLVLMSGDTNIYAKKLYLEDAYLCSDWDDYLRVTAYFSADTLPVAGIYTNNTNNSNNITCTEYPITEPLSANDFIVGENEMPNIARIEIYNRVLSHGEIMSLTNGCNIITDGSQYD